MKILDCESIESTYKSLETILGVKKSDLCQLFNSVKVYDEDCESPRDFLLSYIQEETLCKTNFDKTCWFHATRTWQNNEYDEGLLPVQQAIPLINAFLSKLEGKPINLQIHGNKRNEEHSGPLGFLIRELAFVRNDSYQNFLQLPEIIEDNGYGELYKANTVECIVKFVDPLSSTEALRYALLYAYHKHRSRALDDPLTSLNCFFNGEGVPVAKENICRIDREPLRFS